MKDVNPPPKATTPKGKGKLISDVNTGKQLEFDKSGVMGFLKSLNPLQFASEAIAQLAHYKHQVKILETEQKRIDAEANIRHHQIDSALKAGLQLLDERRNALQMALEVVTKDLEHTHLEKKRVLDCIDNLVANISDPELSSEEKQLSHATMSILSDSLKIMGEQSTVKLDLIAKNTQKALEAMPRSDLILTFSEE
ncbi:MAG: hypothetical protein CMI06_00200 [Oceanospirillaceae bacterium]|nr:hypothetical protein [Oceanospirillaceae bacterium]|tara:strand:+ start:756 stop:1343 length:588 start_codon:yes stop_codon:yes gene_type:complete